MASGFRGFSGPGPSAPNPSIKFPSQSRPTSPSSMWGSGQNVPYQDYDARIDEGTLRVRPFADTSFSGGFAARPFQTQDSRSFRSPPSMYSDGGTLRDSKTVTISRSGFLPNSNKRLAPDQIQSPMPPFRRGPFSDEAQQSTFPSNTWVAQPRPSSNFIRPMLQPVASSVPLPVSDDPKRSSPVQYGDLQGPKRSRSPTFPSGNGGSSEEVGNFITPITQHVTNDPRRRSPVQYGDLQGSKQSRSPTFPSGDGGSSEDLDNFITPLTQRVTNDPRRRSPVQYADVQAQKRSRSPNFSSNDPNGGFLEDSSKFIKPSIQPVISSVPVPITNDPSRRSPVQYGDLHVQKRSRSPTPPSYDGGSSENPDAVQNLQRPSLSPPKMRSSNHFVSPGSQSNHSPSGYHKEVVINRPISSPAVKRTKLPSSSSTGDQNFQETSNAAEDEENRELQARAKRMMRFKDDGSKDTGSDFGLKNQKAPAKRQLPVNLEKNKLNIEDAAADVMVDSINGKAHQPDHEDAGSSGLIVGSCLDMCPESERGERERKGDLDQFERVDGDRNQTSKFLAVKKYTRTAEREAVVIRPMSVLQKTMDYLLNLLNQPYDDKFLGLYNFLWDRMRAIRMDLRMQHIFDTGAIKMLEQMIRLHIVAMHELCEYTKGEGFSEGFDAHLNIEQMNKTSVELFQLYDDHRKKGKSVATEKEFRGYYALLKLDKHPGYKVEPGELSLDLAKMTPEIRQTPEVVFARDVARACRTCNYHAFFKLSRKASYLQACLMHAHFAKLRTLALTALHSGLQNNQGIPMSQIAEWLGMEEESIEDLLEYHGFSIKEYEVPYMVKEGTFLNVDSDYPVKLSKLVNKKKSRSICEDVAYPCLSKSSPAQRAKAKLVDLSKGAKRNLAPAQSLEADNGVLENDEDMLEYVPSPRYDMQRTLSPKTPGRQGVLFGDQPSPASPRLLVLPTFNDLPSSPGNRVGSEGKNKFDTLLRNSFGRKTQVEVKATPVPILPFEMPEANVMLQPVHTVGEDSVQEQPEVEELVAEPIDHVEEIMADQVELETPSYDQEVAEAKLKLILRIWKRLAQKKRNLREQKQLAAIAALNSLSLGPPIWHLDMQSSSPGDFDIERVMRKRYEIREKSLSTLNVSDTVATELGAKNPDAKCLCWKILLLTHNSISGDDSGNMKEISHFTARSWLRSKLLHAGCNDNHHPDLLVSSPGVSVWSKWLPSQSGDDATCFLTVIKEVESGNLMDSVTGASAVVFPVSEHTPWERQRNQLHNVLMALPPASSLPLLLVSGSCEDDFGGSSIIKELRLHDIEKSRLSNFMVSFLKPRQGDQFNGYYSDERLREGLKWLASESPAQPLLCRVKTRKLVLFHLSSLLDTYDNLTPNQCISTFNEALDWSLQKVSAAVDANPTSWPCPETGLLDHNFHEYRTVSKFLPNIGWSSSANTEPLFLVLGDLKLPWFEDSQWPEKPQLESCLIRYLTETSQMMTMAMATDEAKLMIQQFAKVEVHNSVCYIIPNWAMIFQKIFHWRLMDLSDEPVSSAYVLAQDDPSISDSGAFLEVERRTSVSLDEMLAAASYNPPTSEIFDTNMVTEAMVDDDDGGEEEVIAAMAEDEDDDDREHDESSTVMYDITGIKPGNGGPEVLMAADTRTVSVVEGFWELTDRLDYVQNRNQDTLDFY